MATKQVVRVPLCSVEYCPAPSSPAWHECLVCGALAVEHHHTQSRGMGGSKSRKMNKGAVVPLCTEHHDMMSMNKYEDKIEGGWYIVKNKRGNVIVRKQVDAKSTPAGLRRNSNGAEDSHSSAVEFGRMGNKPLQSGPSSSDETDIDVQRVSAGGGKDRADETSLTYSYAEYEEEAARIAQAYNSIDGIKSEATWTIGDFMLRAEKTLGEAAAQLEPIFNLKPRRLQNIVSVCERVHPSRRRGDLPFETHAVVAYMPDEEQVYWLTRAATESLSARKLRRVVKGAPAEKPLLCCPRCRFEGTRGEFVK